MQKIEFNAIHDKEKYLDQLESYEWPAAKFLLKLLRNNTLQDTLGGWAKVFLLTESETLVSFITLSAQDCVAAPKLTPWLGFFHTAPEFRGNRYGKSLIDYAYNIAKSMNYKAVYLATDHVNLYEKYGFSYLESRIDIYGEYSRIYKKDLN